jgi:TP901 family phage tail tape measure protein
VAGKVELAIVLKAFDQASGVFSKTHKRINKMAKAVQSAGKKMSIGFTAPFVAMAGASLKAASTFDKGMSNVSTLIDTNVESMEEMSQAVLDMSTATDQAAVPLEDMTGALFDIRSAGVSAADSISVLSSAAKLGVAGLGTTKQAADLGTSAINAFGLEGAEATRVFNTFFTATKKGKTTIAELSQGFGGVAGTVAANNIELDEFVAITAALTTTGLKASEAYTQQKAVLSGLTRVTKQSRKVFKKLGAKDFPDLVKKSGGFQAAIEKVSGAVDGNKGKLLKLLGSTEALNAVIAITGKQGQTAADALDEMRSGADNLGEAFEKQNKTAAAGMQRTKNAINKAAISLGKILGPVASKVAAIITKVANAFDSLDDDTKEYIVTVAALVATIGPLLIIGGKMVTGFLAIKGAVVGATAAFKAMRASSDAAGASMAGASGKAGGLLGKLGRFAGVAGSLAVVAKIGWEIGRAFDEATGASDKLADAALKVSGGFKGTALARAEQQIFAGKAAQRRKAAERSAFGRELTPEELAQRRQKSMELSRQMMARRAESLVGAPGEGGQGGQGGTVKIEVANLPAGSKVRQTEGQPMDIQVGRQLAIQ